jgi:glycerol-3-phosphate dehydrogenase
VQQGRSSDTAALSRDHTILISDSRLVTITGGKWTTYRKMGEDTIDRAARIGGLPVVKSRTAELRLHGFPDHSASCGEWEQVYGSDLPLLRELIKENPGSGELLDPRLPFRRAEVLWAVRYEMARAVEDVLARRTRALFLDARASIDAAPVAARCMAQELGRDANWEQEQIAAFRRLAEGYLY